MWRAIASIPPPVTGANIISEVILGLIPNSRLYELGGRIRLNVLSRNILLLIVNKIIGRGADYAVITGKRKLFIKDLFILMVTRSDCYLHIHNESNYTRLQSHLFRFLLSGRTLIVVSNYLVKEFSNLTDNICVLSNFAHDESLSCVRRQYWNGKLLCISNLIYEKGIERLFQISSLNGVVIDLYGYPIEFSVDQLNDWSLKYPQSRVEYKGPLLSGAKAEVFGKNYIFIFTSRSECLPLVLLEAMSHSCPIISTNVGAISDCLTHSYNGFFLDQSNDINELLDLIVENYSYYSDNSRRTYEEKFTLSIFEKRVKKIFNV